MLKLLERTPDVFPRDLLEDEGTAKSDETKKEDGDWFGECTHSNGCIHGASTLLYYCLPGDYSIWNQRLANAWALEGRLTCRASHALMGFIFLGPRHDVIDATAVVVPLIAGRHM